MYIFQHSSGTLIAFGFDMMKREPNPSMICWNDPSTGSWETKPDNLAGDAYAVFPIAPEFVQQVGNRVLAYQPGRCVEMTPDGGPYGWSISYLTPIGG